MTEPRIILIRTSEAQSKKTKRKKWRAGKHEGADKSQRVLVFYPTG